MTDALWARLIELRDRADTFGPVQSQTLRITPEERELLIAGLSAVPPAPDWQPIATAPKDGTLIIGPVPAEDEAAFVEGTVTPTLTTGGETLKYTFPKMEVVVEKTRQLEARVRELEHEVEELSERLAEEGEW